MGVKLGGAKIKDVREKGAEENIWT